jgi:uncharacterized protein (TIGR02996 family)
MTQNDFLRAIIAHPEDDLPRLVYADWLEERGDPRGEFIRLQFALRDPDLDPRVRHQMTVREQELLTVHETEWLGELAPLKALCTFRRGFPDELTIGAGPFLERAGRLVRGSTVRAVTLQKVGDLLPTLTRSAALEGLTRLSFPDGVLADADIEHLAACRFLTTLTELDLVANRIGISGARRLAASPNFPNLRALTLDHNPIEDLGLDALAASPNFPALTSLAVRSCDLHASGVKCLTTAPLFGRLHALALDANALGNPGLQMLARARPSAALTVLSLSRTTSNSLGLRPLAASSVVAGLQHFDLRHNQITDGGAQSLVDSAHLHSLVHLDLRGNQLSHDARHQLKLRFGKAVVY